MEIVTINLKTYPKLSFLSIDITLGSYYSFVRSIIDLAKARRSEYICVANVHMLVEASKDPAFAEVVNQATICTPDGMPLTWGMKLLNGVSQDRVAGMDILPDLLREAELNNISVFFYGGSQKTLQETELFLVKKFPKLNVAGMYSPPFRALSLEEEQNVINMINKSHSGILFVALGCPKQEKWMASMKGKINNVMIGIGGALPVMVGMQKRAPIWIQKSGLEWLYRLLQEPKRLFKRYAITNSVFVWLLLKSFLEKTVGLRR